MNDPKPGMAGHDSEPLGYLEEADYHEEHNDDFAPGGEKLPVSHEDTNDAIIMH